MLTDEKARATRPGFFLKLNRMDLKSLLEILQDLWALIAAVITAIVAGYWKWRSSRSKSTQMLYNELENLKQKIILQISKEVEQSTTIAKQENLLNELKSHCPECYEKTKTKLGIHG